MAGNRKGFSIFANIIMILLSISCLLPFVLLIVSSVTKESTITQYGYSFWIRDIDVTAYKYLFSNKTTIVRAYGMTILVVVIGTICNLFMTLFIAYLLSKKDVPGRSFLSFFVFFTMLFSGGMIPSYIIWSQVFHISDTVFGLLLPNLLMSPFNIILMRTYFTTNVPQDILDAAEIDGCSQARMLFRISIPLSKPMISTVALFAALGYWNDWVNGMYYIVRNTKLYTIQNVLNQMQNFNAFVRQLAAQAEAASLAASAPSLSLRMALAVVSVVPMLLIYPFFQKHFVRGIVIGGIKG